MGLSGVTAQGRVAAAGTPAQVIDNPQSPRLKQFLSFVQGEAK